MVSTLKIAKALMIFVECLILKKILKPKNPAKSNKP